MQFQWQSSGIVTRPYNFNTNTALCSGSANRLGQRMPIKIRNRNGIEILLIQRTHLQKLININT
jgi:hypothetical protein